MAQLAEAARRGSHPIAFGVHRKPTSHLRRVHVTLCSKRVALTLLCVAQFMVVLDVSIVNVALPSIGRDLRVSATDLQWVVNAYALTFGGFLLLGGRASDLLGRRRVFVGGLVVFSLSSLAGGLSSSLALLIAARAFQGLGAAVVSPATLSILMTTFTDPAERRRAMGLWGAVAAAGGATGVLLGGLLTELLGWPSVLFVNVPIGLGAVLVARRVLAGENRLGSRGFDITGAATLTGGLGAVVLALLRSQAWGFESARTIGLMVAGAVLLMWFVVQEHRVAAHPLVPLRVFRSRPLSAANVVMFFVGCAMFSTLFMIALYLQQVHGDSPISAGVATVPIGLSIIAGTTVVTRLLPRTGPRPPLVAGMVLIGTAMLLFTRLSPHAPLVTTVLPAEVAFGVGLGLSFVPVTTAAVAGVPVDETGLASGLINSSRSIGGSVGLAVLGTIAADRSRSLLNGHATSLTVAHAALTEGFTRAFAIGSVFAFCAAAVALVQLRQSSPASSPSTPVIAESA